MVINAGKLRERLAFDRFQQIADGYGGFDEGWAEYHVCWAQMIYHRGGEEVEAARLQGQSTYKVRIRSGERSRAITSGFRMRDLHRGTEYNVREVDAVSDRHWIYIVAQSGVAT